MTTASTTSPANLAPQRRIELIDVARGVALLAMAVYHFAWDLEFFGYSEPGTTAVGGWRLFARSIASTFLFLVGVSLVLAHTRGIAWPGYLKRLAMVSAAAAAITAVTWFATPDVFIFFGILHQIALASLLGLLFLRLPVLLILAAGLAVIVLPQVFRSELFNHPALLWVGLSLPDPRSSDYVPLFPWFGAVLLGMAAARIGIATGLTARVAAIGQPAGTGLLAGAGRHSLLFYLAHQPVLIASIWLFAQIFPPSFETGQVQFRQACETACAQDRDGEFCVFYCTCMLDRLEATPSPDEAAVRGYAAQCTMETDMHLQGGSPG